MKPDPRDGLHDRACGICRYHTRGSDGERCPHCGAYPSDYGPILFGYEEVWRLKSIDGELYYTLSWHVRTEPRRKLWEGPPDPPSYWGRRWVTSSLLWCDVLRGPDRFRADTVD